VQEVGRSKYIDPKPTVAELPIFPTHPLKQLGAFVLGDGGPAAPSPIRDVAGFDLDDRGRLGFIRPEQPDRCTFVHLEPDRTILREMSLPIPMKLFTNDYPKAAWLDGDRWVVVLSEHRVGGQASAWWLNASNGEFKAITGFNSAPISKITRSRDGGFVALVVNDFKYTTEQAVIAFDKAGKSRWQIKEDNIGNDRGFFSLLRRGMSYLKLDSTGKDSVLFSPEDLTVTTTGQIAVLDNVRNTIEFFSNKGNFRKALDIEKLWGREPSYLSEITADQRGGIIVQDFQGSSPLVRMDVSGKILSQFTPRHPNGRIIDVIGGCKVSPLGRIWVSDGECLIRLRDDGVADLVLGMGPSEDKLGKIAALTVDQQGRLYAVDERTGAVHVYDHRGTRLRVCKPDVTDFKGKLVQAHVAAAADGSVYLASDSGPDAARFIHFAPDGQRLGVKQSGLDDVHERWYPLSS